MEKSIKSIERIPTWSLGYIMNGDSSDLNDDEITLIDNFLRGNKVICVSCDNDDTYFSSCPAFGLACEVAECTVTYDATEKYGWIKNNAFIRDEGELLGIAYSGLMK